MSLISQIHIYSNCAAKDKEHKPEIRLRSYKSIVVGWEKRKKEKKADCDFTPWINALFPESLM